MTILSQKYWFKYAKAKLIGERISKEKEYDNKKKHYTRKKKKYNRLLMRKA